MSEPINTGGPAFPDKKRIYRGGYSTEDFEPVPGMTLRDYFAAKAVQGLMGRVWDVQKLSPDELFDRWATSAYMLADAMIEARGL